jgi:hypothetical protein
MKVLVFIQMCNNIFQSICESVQKLCTWHSTTRQLVSFSLMEENLNFIFKQLPQMLYILPLKCIINMLNKELYC